jgi:hypothetical protein
MKESDILKLVTDYLSIRGFWWERRNTGAMKGIHNGKSRFVRFSRPGTADVQAIQTITDPLFPRVKFQRVFWIECKAPKGVQSEEQARFQAEVEEAGMTYVLVKQLEDLQAVIG